MNKSEIYPNTLAHRNFELRTYVSGITGDQRICSTFYELTDYEDKYYKINGIYMVAKPPCSI